MKFSLNSSIIWAKKGSTINTVSYEDDMVYKVDGLVSMIIEMEPKNLSTNEILEKLNDSTGKEIPQEKVQEMLEALVDIKIITKDP